MVQPFIERAHVEFSNIIFLQDKCSRVRTKPGEKNSAKQEKIRLYTACKVTLYQNLVSQAPLTYLPSDVNSLSDQSNSCPLCKGQSNQPIVLRGWGTGRAVSKRQENLDPDSRCGLIDQGHNTPQINQRKF